MNKVGHSNEQPPQVCRNSEQRPSSAPLEIYLLIQQLKISVLLIHDLMLPVFSGFFATILTFLVNSLYFLDFDSFYVTNVPFDVPEVITTPIKKRKSF